MNPAPSDEVRFSDPSLPKAAFWMGGSIALLLLMTVSGRESTRGLSVFQVLEMRSVIGLLMLMPLVWREGGLRAMATRHPMRHAGRNVAHYIGQFAWLYAVGVIPLAQVISIEFTAPIWVAVLASLFLGETMTAQKIAAIVLGLVGVIVIIRPDVSALDPGQMVVLGAAAAFAVSITLTKALTWTESAVRILFWMLVIQSILGLIPAILVWRTPELSVMPWILLIAFSGSFSHYCMARAMAHADATVVMPIDFLRVPLAALLGYLVYFEAIDIYLAIGAGLILVGNLLNLRRRPATPPPDGNGPHYFSVREEPAEPGTVARR